MKTVAIIQARMGSTRLPGKIFEDIAGKSMLERTVERVRRSALIDETVVATTEKPEDDAIVAWCKRYGIGCIRGVEEDVLDRYRKAAEETQADVVVRITSDCPLIDPEIIDRVLSEFHETNCDFASNSLERSYPRGLDCEVIRRSALERAAMEATTKREREHVTPYLFDHPEIFAIRSVVHDMDLSSHRWTVDTVEDLTLVRTIYDTLGADGAFGWQDALQLLRDHPEWVAINAHIEQKIL